MLPADLIGSTQTRARGAVSLLTLKRNLTSRLPPPLRRDGGGKKMEKVWTFRDDGLYSVPVHLKIKEKQKKYCEGIRQL